MSQCFTARIPFVRVHAHQLFDEVFRRIADVVPVRRIEFEFTCIRQIRIRFHTLKQLVELKRFGSKRIKLFLFIPLNYSVELFNNAERLEVNRIWSQTSENVNFKLKTRFKFFNSSLPTTWYLIKLTCVGKIWELQIKNKLIVNYIPIELIWIEVRRLRFWCFSIVFL